MNIIVTGGASGLGKAITIRLLNENHHVFFTYRSSKKEALELEAAFKNAKGFEVDFSSQESMVEFCDKLESINADVLINNAITGFTQNYFHKTPSEIFSTSFQQNVVPVIQITQQFIKIARKKKFGKIVTILTSALVNKPSVGWSEYVANKAYIQSLTKSWAIENTSFGITSNCISPSFMATHLTSGIDSRLVETMVQNNPNQALLKEEEVADAVDFFIKATNQLNGANLIINAASDLI